MNLLCYLLFYPVALPGGAARCASTFISYYQLSIVNCFVSQKHIRYIHQINPCNP